MNLYINVVLIISCKQPNINGQAKLSSFAIKGRILTDLFSIEKLMLYLRGPIYGGEIRLKGKKADMAYLRPTYIIVLPFMGDNPT